MYFLKIIRKIRGLLKGKCRNFHLYKKKCELRTAENFTNKGNGLIFKFGCRLL